MASFINKTFLQSFWDRTKQIPKNVPYMINNASKTLVGAIDELYTAKADATSLATLEATVASNSASIANTNATVALQQSDIASIKNTLARTVALKAKYIDDSEEVFVLVFGLIVILVGLLDMVLL